MRHRFPLLDTLILLGQSGDDIPSNGVRFRPQNIMARMDKIHERVRLLGIDQQCDDAVLEYDELIL